MSSLTSLPKRDGFEPLKLSDNSRGTLKSSQRPFPTVCLTIFAFLAPLWLPANINAERSSSSSAVSKTAAAQCQSKLKSLDDFSNKHKPGQTRTTKLTEVEINSYLTLILKPKYHASLNNLVMTFQENKLQAAATINFDQLRYVSKKALPKLIGIIFSGIHTITAEGRVQCRSGRANFILERARFDDRTLPRYLVEEIISAVGRKQRPPYDPMKPSRMPYEINRVEIHQGYIIVFQ